MFAKLINENYRLGDRKLKEKKRREKNLKRKKTKV